MIAAFNAVLPVFLLMVLGFFLFHIRLMTGEFAAHLNRLVYWIGLPSLLFREIATQTLDWGSVSNILLAFFLALSGTILIAYAISFFQKMDESTTGSFVQAALSWKPWVYRVAHRFVLSNPSHPRTDAIARCACNGSCRDRI